MFQYNRLQPGVVFKFEGQIYESLSYTFIQMQQREPTSKVKMRNLETGQVVERSFHQYDNSNLEEVEMVKEPVLYLYSHRGEFWFSEKGNPKNRFQLTEAQIGEQSQYLKPNTEVIAMKVEDKLLGIKIPIKVDLKVTEAPPSLKGNTAQGGDKLVTLETGAKITVPLFINAGDIVRVNTELGTYVERVEKSKE